MAPSYLGEHIMMVLSGCPLGAFTTEIEQTLGSRLHPSCLWAHLLTWRHWEEILTFCEEGEACSGPPWRQLFSVSLPCCFGTAALHICMSQFFDWSISFKRKLLLVVFVWSPLLTCYTDFLPIIYILCVCWGGWMWLSFQNSFWDSG